MVWCVWCGVVWYGVVWCGVVWCDVMMWSGVEWSGVEWSGVESYTCNVICRSFLEGSIGSRVHIRCYFQVCSIQIQYTRSSLRSRFFQVKQLPIFVTDLLYTFLVLQVSGSF